MPLASVELRKVVVESPSRLSSRLMRHLTIKRVLYRTLCVACLASAIAGFLRGQGGYEPFLAVALFCAHAAGDVRLSTVTRCAAVALNFALGTSAKQEGSPPRRRR